MEAGGYINLQLTSDFSGNIDETLLAAAVVKVMLTWFNIGHCALAKYDLGKDTSTMTTTTTTTTTIEGTMCSISDIRMKMSLLSILSFLKPLFKNTRIAAVKYC